MIFRRVFVAIFIACITPLYAIDDRPVARQYTAADPLVYEDAWDLWPYVFLNEHGEPEGFNVDMLKAIFEELNIPYVIKLKPTKEALKDLKEGKSDLMLGMYAAFHDEYAQYGEEIIQKFTHSVVSPKSEPVRIKKIEDLGKYRVILHDGSFSHHMMLDRGWRINCVPYDDMKEAIQKVSSENSGQIVWNTQSLKWLMNKFQTTNLQINPVDIPYGEYRFMSNDSVLLHKVDSVYARLCSMDRMQPILNKWFYPDRVDSGIPAWVGYLAAIIALLAFLMVYYVLMLRVRERKMAKLIAQHNQRLALILRTTKIRVWLYDVQKKTFRWMKENGEMEDDELPITVFGQHYSPLSFRNLTNQLSQMGMGEMENTVTELTSNDDNTYQQYILILSVFRRSKENVPLVIVGMMNDKTEQLQQQQKSKDDMLRFKSIFSSSMIDMTYYNEKGILSDINQKACETLHCDREAILAEHIPFTVALEENNVELDTFEGCHSTHIIDSNDRKELSASIRLTKKIFYEQLLTPVHDKKGRFLGIFGSARDVSEFVSSYHQLKESISQLTSAAEGVTEYINNINFALHVGGLRMIEYSPSTRILTVYEEMHKVQLKLTQSRCLSLVDEGYKRMAMRIMDNMDQHVAEVDEAEIMTVVHTKNHMPLALHFHFVPIRNAKGDIHHYFGLCRDISQEKATEKELEFEKSKAQEVENVKNAFLRNMSHEIRTPISTVVGFAELFVEEHDDEDEESFIMEIKKNATYLLKLVNDILFLSRLDARMIEFNRAPIDFAYAFEGHCQMGWAKQMKAGVKYVMENPYEHLIVDIDESNVGRIIEQVAENAAHNTDRGTVRTRYDYIEDKLLITIDDTGSGISREKQKSIFERFNNSGGNDGTGLGLPICQELATQMGGSVYINSAEGCGTTVWITIPCKASLIEKKHIINSEEIEPTWEEQP